MPGVPKAGIVSASRVASAPRPFHAALRVRSASEYRAGFVEGRRRFYGPLVVHQRANGLGHARLGMAISKRALPRAVDRNRVKRVLREFFRQEAPQWPALDLVVSLSRRNPDYDSATIRLALKQLCGELKRD